MAKSEPLAGEQIADKPAKPERKFRDVRTGFGDAWDFERNGPLLGFYRGKEVMHGLADSQRPGQKRDQPIYQFTPEDAPDALVFVYGSYQLKVAFEGEGDTPAEIGVGDLVQVTFLGREAIKGGAQQINRYRIQVAD
jgi:hypothetical protein